jgi:hypothetical protein
MDIKHITSDSLRRLLSLTEKKDHLIKGIEDVENEIATALKGAATSARDVFAAITPSKAVTKKSGKTSARKPVKAKRTMSSEARARISAATKARWAARRAGKAAKAVVSPKAGKPAKVKKKSGLTPEGRAKLAANMKARWAAKRAGKPAAKVGTPAKKGSKLSKKS